MPEGPTLAILKEETAHFVGRQVIAVAGNTTIDLDLLLHKRVKSMRTWGKHFLISFDTFYVRVHFLMIGSYAIDEVRKAKIRLGLTFSNGVLNFHASNIKLVHSDVDSDYDFSRDIMSDSWDQKQALAGLKQHPEALICDVLLDQDLFSGLGNIIKTEALYRARIHPESVVMKIPAGKRLKLVQEVVKFAFEFLKWKKAGELNAHLDAYSKKHCERCDLPMHKKETGKKKRQSYFCINCQIKYV